MRRWSVVGAVGWLTGLGLGAQGWLPLSFYCVATVMVLGAGAWWYYQTRRGFYLLLLIGALLLAASYMTWTDARNQTVWPTDTDTWEGRVAGQIASAIEIDGNRVQFEFRSDQAEGENASFPTNGEKVLIHIYLEEESQLETVRHWARGEQFVFPVTLELPDGARNPGDFDYRTYLYRQHIHWVGQIEALDEVTRVDTGLHWLRPLDKLRTYLAERTEAVYDHPQSGLIRGMILGERDAVDLQVERHFATLGLLHLLAISGLHVGIVLAMVYGGLKWFGVTREAAAVAALCFLPVYALVTGAQPPVIRASVVAGLVLFAVLWRQWKDSLHFLALAAIVMLVWNPYWLFAAGFQLSFTITLGIIVAVPPLAARLPLGHDFFRKAVAVTLVAQLCSFPLLIYYFNEFSLASGIANFVLVPLVSTVIIPLSFISVILAAIAAPLAVLPAQVNSWLINGLIRIADGMAAWEPLHLVWATPSVWWMTAYFVILFGLYKTVYHHAIRQSRWPLKIGLGIAFMAIVLLAYFPYPWWNRPLTVTFLDVGQGDAIVVETPKRQVLVIDAGGRLLFDREPWEMRRDPFDVGQDIVIPFLRHKGIRQIDYLVASHFDADHVGGMIALIHDLPIVHFIRGPSDTSELSELESDILQALHQKKIPIYRAKSGTGWSLEPGVYWQFLQPPNNTFVGYNRNAQSLVISLTYGGRSILLTGDAELETEQNMLAQWAFSPIDVLKVGHHGSETSTGVPFLHALQPRSAVISVGENNRYDHPHPDVLARLRDAGTTVYRTDRHGGIVFQIEANGGMTVMPNVRDGVK